MIRSSVADARTVSRATPWVNRPPDLCEAVTIDRAAGLGRVKGPPGAVGIEGAGQAPGAQHVGERRHDGGRGLRGPELGIEQALGGVVEDGDQGLPLRGTERQPGVEAAVQMQELAETGARFAPPPMPPTGAALGHQPGLVQDELDEAVREPHAVVAAGELMEVADIESPVAIPIELQHPPHLPAPQSRRRRGQC